MILYFNLEHVKFLKKTQSLGTKHVLEHVTILRHFTDLNNKNIKRPKIYSALIFQNITTYNSRLIIH